jgi:hypothetical protein
MIPSRLMATMLHEKAALLERLNVNKQFVVCSTYGNRTRDSSVKGRRLNPLTNAPLFSGGKDNIASLIDKIFAKFNLTGRQ